MTNPPLDVATHLAAAGLGLTLGVNLFTGPERAPNDNGPPPLDAVFVTGAPGSAPDISNGQVYEHRFPQLNIRVRHRRHDAADATVRAIQSTLQAGVPGYMFVRALQSEPTPSFAQPSGLARSTMSYQLIYESEAV